MATLKEISSSAHSHRIGLESKRSTFIREASTDSDRNIRHYTDVLFLSDIRTAQKAESAAYTAWQEEVEAEALKNVPQPVGTRYVRWDRITTRDQKGYIWRQTEDVAVLEVVTRTTRFADNLASYSQPAVGQMILRLLKKNGEVGLKFVLSNTFIKNNTDSWSDPTWFVVGYNPNDATKAAAAAEAKKKQDAWLANPTLC
jgi:hypothetical protein